MKVLIVDDSLLAEHAIKSYFEKLGHEVVGLSKNGEEAKNKLLELKPDLVTVDEVMPGMNGTEFVEIINGLDKENNTKTRVFIISSDEIPQQNREKIEVDSYILKPITLDKIKDALEKIVA
ncbi:MAG: response regulator [Candidatus Heimdallarchaeota archaeon]|nr:response regulator [Candidatus Heimdallarchaeota archaeon]MDH5646464.1 response regulator [Candidatus Heimdallarchaeota archaeon]